MAKQSGSAIDRVFHALADSTRREILLRIAEQPCTVTELAAPFDMSLNAVSKHLKVLEGAGLLTRTIDGRIHRCSMDGKPLREAGAIIQQYQAFWKGHLDSLEAYFNQMAARPIDKEKEPRK